MFYKFLLDASFVGNNVQEVNARSQVIGRNGSFAFALVQGFNQRLADLLTNDVYDRERYLSTFSHVQYHLKLVVNRVRIQGERATAHQFFDTGSSACPQVYFIHPDDIGAI